MCLPFRILTLSLRTITEVSKRSGYYAGIKMEIGEMPGVRRRGRKKEGKQQSERRKSENPKAGVKKRRGATIAAPGLFRSSSPAHQASQL